MVTTILASLAAMIVLDPARLGAILLGSFCLGVASAGGCRLLAHGIDRGFHHTWASRLAWVALVAVVVAGTASWWTLHEIPPRLARTLVAASEGYHDAVNVPVIQDQCLVVVRAEAQLARLRTELPDDLVEAFNGLVPDTLLPNTKVLATGCQVPDEGALRQRVTAVVEKETARVRWTVAIAGSSVILGSLAVVGVTAFRGIEPPEY